jgi:hypothetical protein
MEPTQPPIHWVQAFLLMGGGLRHLQSVADHSPPSNAKVKNKCNELYTSYQKMVSEKLEGIWFDRSQLRIKSKIRSTIWNQNFNKMTSIILEMNYVKELQNISSFQN